MLIYGALLRLLIMDSQPQQSCFSGSLSLGNCVCCLFQFGYVFSHNGKWIWRYCL